MRRIGNGGNIIVFALFVIVFLLFISLALMLSIGLGILFLIVAIPFLILQWKLKKVILTNREIEITGILRQKKTYPINSVDHFGYFLWPSWCYVRLKNDSQFIFQMPLNRTIVYRLNKPDYLSEVTELLNRYKEHSEN